MRTVRKKKRHCPTESPDVVFVIQSCPFFYSFPRLISLIVSRRVYERQGRLIPKFHGQFETPTLNVYLRHSGFFLFVVVLQLVCAGEDY